MVYPRIIPCLLIRNKGLVKTIQFSDPKYVGDPLNAVKIFNEKEADELIVFDIDATVEKREPDYDRIKNLANECRMPLCYGGGVKTVEQAMKILSLGVEKISLSSVVLENTQIVSMIAKRLGSQSVVVTLDIKRDLSSKKYEIYTHNGKRQTGITPFKLIPKLQDLGAGEIVINSIDNDGKMKGYDFNLIDKIYSSIQVPMSVVGGAGSLNDIEKLINRYGIIGAVAGSLFVFKGTYRAVLINYPNKTEKERLMYNKI